MAFNFSAAPSGDGLADSLQNTPRSNGSAGALSGAAAAKGLERHSMRGPEQLSASPRPEQEPEEGPGLSPGAELRVQLPDETLAESATFPRGAGGLTVAGPRSASSLHSRERRSGQPPFRFSKKRVSELAYALMEERLANLSYDPVLCKNMSYELAAEILRAINESNDCNYKMVVIMSLGSIEHTAPKMQMGTKCLWDPDRDRLIAVPYKNESLFAVALIYGFHYRK